MEQISLFSLLPESRKRSSLFPNSFICQGLYITLLRRPYCRTIQLGVEATGKVQVSCGLRTSVKEIKTFVEDHWKWIQKQILEQKKIKRKYPVKKFHNGELFLFQGRKLILQYKRVPLKPGGFSVKKGFCVRQDKLIYSWSQLEDLGTDCLTRELRSFYEKTGKSFLQKTLAVFSSRMQLIPNAVRIGSQRSLWGSCSSEGNISLNWRLVVAPPDVISYVVIHELAHLKYLDHSTSFWSLVACFCSNYKKCEDWLVQNTYAADFLLFRPELHG